MSILKYQPTCEQEVVALFCSNLTLYGYKVKKLAEPGRYKILTIRTSFPDCIIEDSKDNSQIRIEFEFYSKNFKHPVNGCDCIVCWVHDWYDCPANIEIVELYNKEIFKILKVNPEYQKSEKDISGKLIRAAFDGISLGDYKAIINKYNANVRDSEALLFIARMLSGKASPVIENGKLFIRNKPEFKMNKWSVSKEKVLLKQAKILLTDFGYFKEYEMPKMK